MEGTRCGVGAALLVLGVCMSVLCGVRSRDSEMSGVEGERDDLLGVRADGDGDKRDDDDVRNCLRWCEGDVPSTLNAVGEMGRWADGDDADELGGDCTPAVTTVACVAERRLYSCASALASRYLEERADGASPV